MITGADVSVVIPSLPDRSSLLARAIRSVERQTVQPAKIITQIDRKRLGAAVARNAALKKVTTPWVAFLDDDDEFHYDHLATLIEGANVSGADLVGTYPEPNIPGVVEGLVSCLRGIPVRGPVHIPWGSDQLDHFDARRGPVCPHCSTQRGSFIMVTNLVRMSLIVEVGGFPAPGSMGDDFAGYGAEDYLFLLALLDAGAHFHHVTGRRTWTYRVDGKG